MDNSLEPYPQILEAFVCSQVPPPLMDRMWAQGWRHFGTQFFRYSISEHDEQTFHVKPLRVHLPSFQPGKRFRQILRMNADLSVSFAPTVLTEEDQALFVEHRTRFKFDPPDSLQGFLGEAPDVSPCLNVACRARLGDRLVALSFLDWGERASSSVYGCFALDQSRRSLGLWTMLQEISLARARGQEWYYPGYVYHEPSFYDYKKRFRPYQWFDWRGQWREEAVPPYAV